MHYWGDGFEYFDDVAHAAKYIGKFCKRWGRINVTQYKEKYGQSRIYCSFGFYKLGEFFYPGTMYYGHLPKIIQLLWRVYTPKWFTKLLLPYQIFIYRLAYKNAIKKYPHIKEEILCCADYPEYLKGL